MAPVIAALAGRDGIEQRIVHTGQHYDARMSEEVDAVTFSWHASFIAFHIAGAFSLLVALMLSIGLPGRDRRDGTAIYMLARPVCRWEYVLGSGGI